MSALGPRSSSIAIVWILSLPPTAYAEQRDPSVTADQVLTAAQSYFVRVVCETKIVPRMDAAFKKRFSHVSPASPGFAAKKKAFADELSTIWHSEAISSNEYMFVKLTAAALLQAGMDEEAKFADAVRREAKARCPAANSDDDAVISAVMGLVPLIANDPRDQPNEPVKVSPLPSHAPRSHGR